jgi:hypothetical protein
MPRGRVVSLSAALTARIDCGPRAATAISRAAERDKLPKLVREPHKPVVSPIQPLSSLHITGQIYVNNGGSLAGWTFSYHWKRRKEASIMPIRKHPTTLGTKTAGTTAAEYAASSVSQTRRNTPSQEVRTRRVTRTRETGTGYTNSGTGRGGLSLSGHRAR